MREWGNRINSQMKEKKYLKRMGEMPCRERDTPYSPNTPGSLVEMGGVEGGKRVAEKKSDFQHFEHTPEAPT